MNRAPSARRRVVKPAEQQEAKPISEKDRNVYRLISAGFLPSADAVTRDGRPAWSFESLAHIVGCKEAELEELLTNQGRQSRSSQDARH